MNIVYGRELYGRELDEFKKLKEKYEGYTKYGLFDEIRKLQADLRGKDDEIRKLQADLRGKDNE